MFKNANHEDHFLGAKTPPVSPTGHDVASLGQDSQGSSWVSMLSLVSRPALSLLQKVLPGRTRTPALSDCISGFSSGDFKQNLVDAESVFLGQLDNIIPVTQRSTHMAYLHCQQECAAELQSDCAGTFNWLTADSLSELGIENAAEINVNIQPQTSVGYLETVRSLLSQVVLNTASAQEMRHAETGQLIGGETWSSAVTSPSKSTSNWWGGFWGSEDKSQSWLSNLSWSKEVTGTSAQNSSKHYIQSEMGTKAAVAKPTELFSQWHNVESMHGESAGPPRHKEELLYNANLQTTRPESLQSSQGLPLEHWPATAISSRLVSTGAATACSEVAVLTPDQDHGYSSLEEEHTTSRLYMVKMNGDSISSATMSAGGREREEQGETAASGDMDGGEEEQGRVNSDLSESEDEEEPPSPAGPHACPLPTPTCQNRAIAYIMGSTFSDDNQSDDSLSEDEEDDDGFDSEGCSDSSDSEGLDDEDDDQDDESNSEQAEAERLWNSLCQNKDPYNLHNFTATIRTTTASPPRTVRPPTSSSATCSPHASPLNQPLSPSPLSSSPPSPAPLESWDESSASEMDDAESLHLWNSFTASSDPYSPLNFQAPLRTQVPRQGEGGQGRKARMGHRHGPSSSPQDKTSEAEERLDSGFSETLGNALPATTITSHCCVAMKKVRFCEQVEEFYSGPEDRRSPWEQLARDRCRFLRRVQEVEEAIGHVLVPASRLLAYQRLGQQQREHS
ncbi:dentin sialophosphoprotein [Osmerus mordax]|uniref:dentin sialophosphoprotein n=1 Tax=Osmerus mordax TaxID=8014 RepID=UPI00351043F1